MHRVNMNYLIGLEQNNGDYSWEIICCIIGPGNDQVNVKLEGNGLRDGVAGPGRICWLFAHGCAAAVAGREMCFYSKPLRRPNSLPTTNAVNQLSGVHRKDETSFLSFHFPCCRVPYWRRHLKIVYLWHSGVCRVSASVNITRHF